METFSINKAQYQIKNELPNSIYIKSKSNG